MGRQVHGPDWDPSSQPFDGEVNMRVGGGKKHGRYYIGDGLVDTASTPTLSQIRARSTANSPAIRPQPGHTPTAVRVTAPSAGTLGYFLFIHSSFVLYIYLLCIVTLS